MTWLQLGDLPLYFSEIEVPASVVHLRGRSSFARSRFRLSGGVRSEYQAASRMVTASMLARASAGVR